MATELHIPDQRGRIKRLFVRDGIAGNYDVIYEMVRVIRNAVEYDKGLENYAKNLLAKARYDSYADKGAILRTIYDSVNGVQYDADGYIVHGVAYIQDVAGRIESIKSPRATLSDKYGDCDDQAILVAALLGAIGFEDVRIAMARYAADETFAHVYPVVYVNGKRYAMDTTLPNGAVGKEVKAFEVKEIGVFDDIEGLDGLGGVFNNARYYSRKLARAAIGSIPNAAEVLPFGFVVGNALATGADLLNRSSGVEQLSFNAMASKINRALDALIWRLIKSQIALDNAESRAAALVAQFGTIQSRPADQITYDTVRRSVEQKFTFIKNFDDYAARNGIKVVNLDSRAMTLAGLAIIGGGAYVTYRRFFGSKK